MGRESHSRGEGLDLWELQWFGTSGRGQSEEGKPEVGDLRKDQITKFLASHAKDFGSSLKGNREPLKV